MQKLFKHQKEGIEFLVEKNKVILADEMGLGKTRQAIMAAFRDGNKILVVCPASLKINWKREIRIVQPFASIDILSTTEPDPGKNGKWYIINYDILEKKLEFINELIEAGVDTLIMDEAHYIKGKSIRAAAIVGGIAKRKTNGQEIRVKHDGIAGRMKNVYALTGTPLLNRPIEMFNLLKAIGHELGRVRSHFAVRYCGAYLKTIIRRYAPPIRYMDETGATNLDELRMKLKGQMLRRKKKDVLDLPDKIVQIMECEMTDKWQKSYDTAWDRYLEFLRENPAPDKNIENILMARHLVEITKLKQVCSLSKIDRMVDDISNAVESGEKVVVFTQYKKTLKEIEIKAREIKYDTGKNDYFGNPIMKNIKVVTLSGEDDMGQRQISVDAFQSDHETKVFVANIKAGGVGLNLTNASIVMFADMEWSPEIHRQAEDRAHRIGQKGTVNVYYYIAMGTIEEDIVEILNSKKHVMDQILEGGRKRVKSESMQEAFLKMLGKKISTAGDKRG